MSFCLSVGVCPWNEEASELPGYDSEGDDRTAGFEVQSGEEAFDGCFIFPLSLQDLPEAVPGLVAGVLDLDGVSEDLLGQLPPPKPVEHQALPTNKGGAVSEGTRRQKKASPSSQQDGQT